MPYGLELVSGLGRVILVLFVITDELCIPVYQQNVENAILG